MTAKTKVFAATVGVALAWGVDVRAEPTGHDRDPAPAGYHVESRPPSPLLVTGGVMFAVPYALSFAAGWLSYSLELLPLILPVVGPFLQMAITHVSHPPDDSGGRAAVLTVLALDGALQSVGLTLALVGASLPRVKLVKDGPEAIVVPIGPLGSAGLSVGATF